MFKVEITKNNKVISKIFNNSLSEDWARYLPAQNKVTKDKIKIYWIKNLDKKAFKRDELDFDEAGKVKKGKKLKFNLHGEMMLKKEYEKFVDDLSLNGVIDAQEFKSNKKMKQNKDAQEFVDVADLSIFNKEHFIKESEFELVELRWPYDSNNNFIGFNFDPDQV